MYGDNILSNGGIILEIPAHLLLGVIQHAEKREDTHEGQHITLVLLLSGANMLELTATQDSGQTTGPKL